MTTTDQSATPRRWSPRSLAILILAWLILQIGGLFTPGLLDDVDSVYIEIAREMMQRHDYVTPYINGIRFFDKPPLMYWMAAGSMHLFGIHDWAARLPLALLVLALLLAVYALGIRLFAAISPTASPDRGGFYAALAMATSIGPYLYTRFYIPDILLALWMTLAVHLFLIALDRINAQQQTSASPPLPRLRRRHGPQRPHQGPHRPRLPHRLRLPLPRDHKTTPPPLQTPPPRKHRSLPRHRSPLAHPRRPPQPSHRSSAGLGLPATAGWAWFYLYNEHIARFLSKRIPHDYGLTPVWLFWLYLVLWIFPWAIFLPTAVTEQIRTLRNLRRPPANTKPLYPSSSGRSSSSASSPSPTARSTTVSPHSPLSPS